MKSNIGIDSADLSKDGECTGLGSSGNIDRACTFP